MPARHSRTRSRNGLLHKHAAADDRISEKLTSNHELATEADGQRSARVIAGELLRTRDSESRQHTFRSAVVRLTAEWRYPETIAHGCRL